MVACPLNGEAAVSSKENTYFSTTLLCKKKQVFYFAVSCYVIYPINSAQYVYHRAIGQTSLSYLPHQILSFPLMEELSG